MYKQEDQEGDSEEENDFSRDNINVYKNIEQEFSRSGIENKNAIIAYKMRRKHQRHNRLLENTYDKIRNLSSTSENDETTSASGEETDGTQDSDNIQ
jgi:hypothetical protein